MPGTGVITGTCHSSKVPALQKVQGVSAVEEEVKIQLPGPNSPVQ
jgi:hypothetical protein